MYNLENKTRSTVTLLATSFLMLMFCIASPAQAVRVKHRTKYKTANEVSPLWSFQSAIDKRIDDNEGNFSGIQFSINRFLSPTKSVRFTVGVAQHRPIYNNDNTYHSDGVVYTFDNYRGFEVTGVNFSLQGMFYSSPDRQPRLFWGLGPRLGFSDANPTVLVSYYDEVPYEWDEILLYDDATRVTFGIEGSLGFEWFLGSNLSMVAEYGLAVQGEWYVLDVYDYQDAWYRWHTVSEVLYDGIHLDDSHIKLGLSMYF